MVLRWRGPAPTLWATNESWKQQCGSKKLGAATQTQSVLPNYNRNLWLLSKLLGTRRSNGLSSRPDLWSSLCFVLSWSYVFLLHTDPRSARQNRHNRTRWTSGGWFPIQLPGLDVLPISTSWKVWAAAAAAAAESHSWRHFQCLLHNVNLKNHFPLVFAILSTTAPVRAEELE